MFSLDEKLEPQNHFIVFNIRQRKSFGFCFLYRHPIWLFGGVAVVVVVVVVFVVGGGVVDVVVAVPPFFLLPKMGPVGERRRLDELLLA